MLNANLAVDLDGLLDALAEKVAEKLSARRLDAGGLIDLARVPVPKRRLYAAAKCGELKATKVGKRWLAKIEDLNAWLEDHAANRASNAPSDEGGADTPMDVASMERALGLRRAK
jgi:excisionase family DNA binding protein